LGKNLTKLGLNALKNIPTTLILFTNLMYIMSLGGVIMVLFDLIEPIQITGKLLGNLTLLKGFASPRQLLTVRLKPQYSLQLNSLGWYLNSSSEDDSIGIGLTFSTNNIFLGCYWPGLKGEQASSWPYLINNTTNPTEVFVEVLLYSLNTDAILFPLETMWWFELTKSLFDQTRPNKMIPSPNDKCIYVTAKKNPFSKYGTMVCLEALQIGKTRYRYW